MALEGDLTSCGAVLIAERASPQEIAAATAIMQGRGFDEAMQFTNDQGQPLGRVYYKLYVGNELVYKGTTGEDSITARVFTDTPMPITKAFIEPDTPFCCASSVQQAGEVTPLEVDLKGVSTNAEKIGESVVQVKADVKSRPMTAGEIAMCRLIFKDAIDYSKVKIHKGAFMPGAGGNAMTPYGEPHFPVKKNKDGIDVAYQDDFAQPVVTDSESKNELIVWFIHEMVHVWQYQMGYSVATHGAWIGLKGGYGKGSPAYRYDYTQDSGHKILSDFNMEQQGDIIARYFAVRFLNYAGVGGSYLKALNFHIAVLQNFLNNPKYANLLPNTTHF